MKNSSKQNKRLQTFKYELINNDTKIDISTTDKPLFILFWSINCKYSINEIININNIINKYSSNINFLFINCGDNINDLKEYINKQKNPIKDIKKLNICSDKNDYITNLLNIEEIPTCIITDKNLIIHSILIGKNRIDKYKNSIENILDKEPKTKLINTPTNKPIDPNNINRDIPQKMPQYS